MYQSRYHYQNDFLSVAIDSLTGELLELVDRATGENLIKNSSFLLRQPFQLFAVSQEKKFRLFGGNVYEIARDQQLRPSIASETDENGVVIRVSYPMLTDGEKSYHIPLHFEVILPHAQPELNWRLNFCNREPKLTIEDVRFPCLNGVYFGETWKTDTLVYPYNAGLKIQNPVDTFCQKASHIYWKWQEYRYTYSLGNMASGPDEDGLYALDYAYSGPLSMTWLDYYGEDMGLYFANHDPLPRNCSLRAETYGTDSPGMNFCFVHHPFCASGEDWVSPPLVTAIHKGDWHRGAKRYQAFREGLHPTAPNRPQWFEKSPGLVAHYDLKYQNGGVVHRYEDIPGLLDEARELGLNHLLLAGWHHDGFDHGFAEYYSDPDLGTEEDLIKAVKTVREKGGHLCFYINSRMANQKYDPLGDFTKKGAVLKKDGAPFGEAAGNKDLNFAVMCIQSPVWRARLEEALQYTVEKVGADGVYLDQLAMAPPCICHNPSHQHDKNHWNSGYQTLLDNIVKRREETNPHSPMGIIHEGVSDSYGGYSAGQLISTFSYYCSGAFPELYKYTYPQQILVDMLYPKSNMAMRPVHIGQASTDIINKAFVTGAYFWVYDLVDDNTFTRDPLQLSYLKDVIALRSHWLEHFGHGFFKDTDGIASVPQNAMVKRFDRPNGILLAAAGTWGNGETVLLQWDKKPRYAATYTVLEGKVQTSTPMCNNRENLIEIPLPNAPISLIALDFETE